MKIEALVEQFNHEVTLKHDNKDYARCVAWLRVLGISPGAKAPSGKGIVPHLVHNLDNSKSSVTIDWG